MAGYAGWNEALLEMLSHTTQCFKWGIRDRDPLDSWTRGPIALLGDAAHPMMPTLAQGAAITLEDAFVLARALARHGDDPLAGLKAYEAERLPRARDVQLQARQQFAEQPHASCAAAAQPRLDLPIRRDARAGRGLSRRSGRRALSTFISGGRLGSRAQG